MGYLTYLVDHRQASLAVFKIGKVAHRGIHPCQRIVLILEGVGATKVICRECFPTFDIADRLTPESQRFIGILADEPGLDRFIVAERCKSKLNRTIRFAVVSQKVLTRCEDLISVLCLYGVIKTLLLAFGHLRCLKLLQRGFHWRDVGVDVILEILCRLARPVFHYKIFGIVDRLMLICRRHPSIVRKILSYLVRSRLEGGAIGTGILGKPCHSA